MRKGAMDYLQKPIERDVLLVVLGRAIERSRLVRENRMLQEQLRDRFRIENIVGAHGSMQDVFRIVHKVAASTATVLIYGESGTGKELIARALHHQSDRRDRPFYAVNIAALPESILEAELFGHEKGAFTGAVRERRGTFEQADGGTLFLDEIGDMPLTMQVKLLRVIQERSIVRVGGERAIPVAIRLVCATHRDLLARVADGRFREDLYYRIHVVQLHIPPLRERREDILWLADRILRELADGRPPRRLDAAAEQALLAADWPGNVRELRHCLERACILDGSPVLGAASLAGRVHKEGGNAPPLSLADHVAQSERRHIAETLSAAGGRIGEAAARLGISRKTLWEKMRRHGLSAEPSD
jgi:DNA-binding NtrC family response regulator